MGFFKSFFSGKQEKPETEKQKNDQKNFEIFKYDGMRAQRMGRPDYAIKCFTEALALQEDFETMSYLSEFTFKPMPSAKRMNCWNAWQNRNRTTPPLSSPLPTYATCKKTIRQWQTPHKKLLK